MRRTFLFALLLVFLVAGAAGASVDSWGIVIGDFDGFGFNGVDGPNTANDTGPWLASSGPPLVNAAAIPPRDQAGHLGLPADTDGDGILEIEDTGGPVISKLKELGLPVGASGPEYLPDVNKNAQTNALGGDVWDNRSTDEVNDDPATHQAVGSLAADIIIKGSTCGSNYTDLTIAATYDLAAIGPPNALTDDNYLGPNPGRPAAFCFEFSLPDTVPMNTIGFGLIFGDYDVSPAEVQISGPNVTGGMINIPLTIQDNNNGQDGLIQAALASLSWNDVFGPMPVGGRWEGLLDMVVLSAPNEPYHAIDAVVLGAFGIPEPGTYALFGLGALGLLAWRRRRAA